jgi:hypothetical protein
MSSISNFVPSIQVLDGLDEQTKVGNCQPSLAEIIHRGQQALTRVEHSHWPDWRDIILAHSAGRSLVLHETKANNTRSSRYRKAMGVWLRCYGFDRIDKADRCRLFECADNLGAIDEWHASLPPERQLGLNHPRVVLTHWKRSLRPAGNKVDTATESSPTSEEADPLEALAHAFEDVTLEGCLRAMPQSWRDALEQRVTEHLSVEQLLKLLEHKIEPTPKTRAALKDIHKAVRRPQLELVANPTADKPTQAVTKSKGAPQAFVGDDVFGGYRQMSLGDLENRILTIQRAAGRGSHLTPAQWAKLDRMRARAAELKRNLAASVQGQGGTMVATA